MIVAVHTWRDHYLMWSDKKCTNNNTSPESSSHQCTTSKTISTYTAWSNRCCPAGSTNTQHHFEYIHIHNQGWNAKRAVCYSSIHIAMSQMVWLVTMQAMRVCVFSTSENEWEKERSSSSKNGEKKSNVNDLLFWKFWCAYFRRDTHKNAYPSDSA